MKKSYQDSRNRVGIDDIPKYEALIAMRALILCVSALSVRVMSMSSRAALVPANDSLT